MRPKPLMPTRTAIGGSLLRESRITRPTVERLAPGVARGPAKLLFDAQQLVVLVNAFAAGGRARLDLSRVGADGEIGDGRVLSFPGAMRNDAGKACLASELHGLQGLGDAADLVDLDQDRVRGALSDAPLQAFHISYEQVIADKLDAIAEAPGQLAPTVPVVFGQAILDRKSVV